MLRRQNRRRAERILALLRPDVRTRMDPVEWRLALLAATVLESPWIPDGHKEPTGPQAEFYMTTEENVFFGGSKGPGKSEGLLVRALQYWDLPGYAAKIFRRTYRDLAEEGAIMDRAIKWLVGRPDVHWDKTEKRFTNKLSGSSVGFGAIEHLDDVYKYQGAELQYAGFDEMCQFFRRQVHYLRLQLRRPQGSLIPIRCDGAGNPDGVGERWVYEEFVRPWEQKSEASDHRFLPALFDTNPYLDSEYRGRLEKADPVTKAKYLFGKWLVKPEGMMFREHVFHRIDAKDAPVEFDALVRAWDLAWTEPSETNKDPDWTRGGLYGVLGGKVYVLDMKSLRKGQHEVNQLLEKTAEDDGIEVAQILPQDPSAGKGMFDLLRASLLGYAVYKYQPHGTLGAKELMARPVSASVDAGDVYVVEAPWTDGYIEELSMFPTKGWHDDQVDTASAAWERLRWLVVRLNGRKVCVGVRHEAIEVIETIPTRERPSRQMPDSGRPKRPIAMRGGTV